MPTYALDPKVGDRLTAVGISQYAEDFEVEVIKVARVKFEAVPVRHLDAYRAGRTWHAQTWRKDTGQRDGRTGGHRIQTKEMIADERRQLDARGYLLELGLDIHRLKRDVISVVELADLIRGHVEKKEN
jgi:hypothetical protein